MPWTPEAEGPGYAGHGPKPCRPSGMGGADQEPWSRTCKQYWATAPAVLEILDERKDFDEGRLGNVDDMEEPRWFYLRVVSGEHKAWENYWRDELTPDTSSGG